MKKLLSYLAIGLAAATMAVASCSDPSASLEQLKQQIDSLAEQGRDLGSDAESLGKLIEAVQRQDALVSFEPLAENGRIVGFKAVFKEAGEVTVYNRNSAVQVGEDGGKYYWMSGGEWLTGEDGNRVEIIPENPVPQFRTNGGSLEVSVDGGKSFKPVGQIDKCLITSVTEDAARVVFTINGGAQIIIHKHQALTLSLNGDDTVIGAGGSVTVTYEIEGAENAQITALCGDGWSVEVKAQSATAGTIVVTAPTPIAQDKVIVFASDGKGRMVAVEMRLEIDESGNPDDPPEPPVPPEQPILVPVKTSYNVSIAGGEVVAGLITNVEYEVSTSETWIQYVGTKAVRTDNLAFNVEANDNDPRSATATITSGNYSTQIAFLQAGINRYLSLSENKLIFDFEADDQAIVVYSNVDYSYEISDSWVSITKLPSSTEDMYVVAVDENTVDEPRTATVTFSGAGVEPQVLTVEQEAMSYYLSISKENMIFTNAYGTDVVKVLANTNYTCTSSSEWISVSGTPGPGRRDFEITVTENDSYDVRTGSVIFNSTEAGSKMLTVTQRGRSYPIPRTDGGANLYNYPGSGYHYRYGPSIIINDDGSLDVWTSKEGGNYLYYGLYAYQETGSRRQMSAAGHTLAQYFNIQHKFASIQMRMYGTSSDSDAITIKLYQWKGSYSATVASQPIATRSFTNITASGNRYRVYQSSQAMMPAGEYLWTATEATQGVGIYYYTGAGSSSITDAVSYLDGTSTNAYNFEMRPRGRATGNYANVDRFAYFHSENGGTSWTAERDVLFGTEGFEDEWSVCDPGAAHFGGWYYLGYTSAPGKYNGTFNHCYLARSRTPVGPWYKWNGSGWGGEPAKVIEFTGATGDWGIGEPSIVVKDNTVFLYYTLTENSVTVTKVRTAPLSENWPAHLTDRGVAMDKRALYSCDSADVKYVEDYGLFYAFHTYNRMTSSSKIAVWVSEDGLRFSYIGDMTGSFQPGMHNMGVSGDGEGHIRLSQQQYVSYAYVVTGEWGQWSTWFGPIYFE